MIQSMKEQLAMTSSLPIANAAELVARVIQNIAGNDISTSVNGNKLTRDAIAQLSAQRIVKQLQSKLPEYLQNAVVAKTA